jgi:hypothetical protein
MLHGVEEQIFLGDSVAEAFESDVQCCARDPGRWLALDDVEGDLSLVVADRQGR